MRKSLPWRVILKVFNILTVRVPNWINLSKTTSKVLIFGVFGEEKKNANASQKLIKSDLRVWRVISK